jgi:hypothetical protein
MSAATTQTAAPRFDIYGPIHKALRAFMGDTLVSVGRMDTNDEREVSVVLEQARSLLELLTLHVEDENRFVHRAMEERRGGSATRTAHDHVEHELALAELGRLLDAVQGSTGAERAAATSRLYRRLALFVAENLEHMNVEERDNAEALWAEYSDQELMELEASIQASVPPRLMAVATGWMMKALSHTERVGLLQGVCQSAPAEAFEGVLAIARSNLSERDWTKLVNDRALPSVRAA